MGNTNDCCSDGVLIGNRFNYPTSFGEGVPHFSGDSVSNGNITSTFDYHNITPGNVPTVPMVEPPSANMDGLSMRTTRLGS